MLPDSLGQKHSLIRPRLSKRFWEKIFGFMMADTYFSLVIMDDWLSLITHLQLLRSMSKVTLTKTYPLSCLMPNSNYGIVQNATLRNRLGALG